MSSTAAAVAAVTAVAESSSTTPPTYAYFGVWDWPKETCMYTGEMSLIPGKTSAPLPSLEGKIRQYAVNLENGSRTLQTLVRLCEIRAPLELFQKYNIRKLAGKFLYKSETMNQVVKLAKRIKYMEKKENEKKKAVAAAPTSNDLLTGEIDISATLDRIKALSASSSSTSSSSSSSSPPTPPFIDSGNIFLSSSTDVSATLDRLLKFVKKTDQSV